MKHSLPKYCMHCRLELYCTLSSTISHNLDIIALTSLFDGYKTRNKFLIFFINLCIRSLLEDGHIELSYFCGGILSNILLEWSEEKKLHLCSKQDMLLKLVKNLH